jgi:hypothetical protein
MKERYQFQRFGLIFEKINGMPKYDSLYMAPRRSHIKIIQKLYSAVSQGATKP